MPRLVHLTAALGLSASLLAGCASAIYGRTPERLELTSDPPGATATLYGLARGETIALEQLNVSRMISSAKTPGFIPNPAKSDQLTKYAERSINPNTLYVVFQKGRYKPQVVKLQPQHAAGCSAVRFAESLLIVPALIDRDAACSTYEPTRVHVVLEEAQDSAPDAPRE
jgi:hypothetical protein